MTNVGVRPTVDTDGGVTVESHLLEPVGELYGADCRVEFLRMLPEKGRSAAVFVAEAEIVARHQPPGPVYLGQHDHRVYGQEKEFLCLSRWEKGQLRSVKNFVTGLGSRWTSLPFRASS